MKRASAFLLDFILVAIIAVGFAALFSHIFHYDSYSQTYSDKLAYYGEKYNVTFEITAVDYDNFTEAEKANWDAAYYDLIDDGEAIKAYNVMVWMIVSITSVSLLISFMVIEFIVPKIFGNGQTVGKRIFGLAVMRTSGVKISTISLFIRTFLGKYVIETMIPALICTMILFNSIGFVGPVIIGILVIVNGCMILFSTNRSMIHDFISDCVVVDLASQLIFDNEEAMIEYKKKVAAEEANRSKDY